MRRHETGQILNKPEGVRRVHRALTAVDRIVNAYLPTS